MPERVAEDRHPAGRRAVLRPSVEPHARGDHPGAGRVDVVDAQVERDVRTARGVGESGVPRLTRSTPIFPCGTGGWSGIIRLPPIAAAGESAGRSQRTARWRSRERRPPRRAHRDRRAARALLDELPAALDRARRHGRVSRGRPVIDVLRAQAAWHATVAQGPSLHPGRVGAGGGARRRLRHGRPERVVADPARRHGRGDRGDACGAVGRRAPKAAPKRMRAPVVAPAAPPVDAPTADVGPAPLWSRVR